MTAAGVGCPARPFRRGPRAYLSSHLRVRALRAQTTCMPGIMPQASRVAPSPPHARGAWVVERHWISAPGRKGATCGTLCHTVSARGLRNHGPGRAIARKNRAARDGTDLRVVEPSGVGRGSTAFASTPPPGSRLPVSCRIRVRAHHQSGSKKYRTKIRT